MSAPRPHRRRTGPSGATVLLGRSLRTGLHMVSLGIRYRVHAVIARIVIVGLASIVVLLVGADRLFHGRSDAVASDQRLTAPAPVVIAIVQTTDIPIYLSGIGTVQAYNSVAIKSRIDGQLQQLKFREGQSVAAGDVLAVLDKRPLEATLKQMEANLHKDQAQVANAKVDLARFQGLKEYATRQSVETQGTLVAQLEAQIAADVAQVEYATAQLDYAMITSPIAGRTGLRQIDVGNIVHAADPTPIVTVTQLDPISLIFTVNADDLQAVDKAMAAGVLPVTAYAKDNRTELAEGSLDLIDNQIDQTTGTVKLKASFPNKNGLLWPGQFVNARVRVAIRHDGIAIPSAAVQQGPNGPYVWVVAANDTVSIAPVTVANTEDGHALIDSGLQPGQRIVIDGQYNLEPGSRTAPAAADAAAS